MIHINHPEIQERQKLNQAQGMDKVYHMDIDKVMGREPEGEKGQRKRFTGQLGYENTGT